jgi:hypothetical protein
MTKIHTANQTSPVPEFGPLPKSGGDRITGLSRAMLYKLEQSGDIRLVRIRRPGQILGRVLIDYASVRAYLAKMSRKQSAAKAVAKDANPAAGADVADNPEAGAEATAE